MIESCWKSSWMIESCRLIDSCKMIDICRMVNRCMVIDSYQCMSQWSKHLELQVLVLDVIIHACSGIGILIFHLFHKLRVF